MLSRAPLPGGGKKDFEIILVPAIPGRRLIGERLDWEEFAEAISTGMWEARMHQHQGRCSKILFTFQRCMALP